MDKVTIVIYSSVDIGRNGVGMILNIKRVQCVRSHIAYDDGLIHYSRNIKEYVICIKFWEILTDTN